MSETNGAQALTELLAEQVVAGLTLPQVKRLTEALAEIKGYDGITSVLGTDNVDILLKTLTASREKRVSEKRVTKEKPSWVSNPDIF